MSDDDTRYSDDTDAYQSARAPRRESRRIQREVMDLFAADTDLDASEIDVSVDAGVVTLDGSIDGRMARERAEELADSVKGVTAIENNLIVRPDFARSFEDEPEVADLTVDNTGPRQMAVSDVTGSDWGGDRQDRDNRGIGVGGLPADTGAGVTESGVGLAREGSREKTKDREGET